MNARAGHREQSSLLLLWRQRAGHVTGRSRLRRNGGHGYWSVYDRNCSSLLVLEGSRGRHSRCPACHCLSLSSVKTCSNCTRRSCHGGFQWRRCGGGGRGSGDNDGDVPAVMSCHLNDVRRSSNRGVCNDGGSPVSHNEVASCRVNVAGETVVCGVSDFDLVGFQRHLLCWRFSRTCVIFVSIFGHGSRRIRMRMVVTRRHDDWNSGHLWQLDQLPRGRGYDEATGIR